jgi:hypothetical protein
MSYTEAIHGKGNTRFGFSPINPVIRRAIDKYIWPHSIKGARNTTHDGKIDIRPS